MPFKNTLCSSVTGSYLLVCSCTLGDNWTADTVPFRHVKHSITLLSVVMEPFLPYSVTCVYFLENLCFIISFIFCRNHCISLCVVNIHFF